MKDSIGILKLKLKDAESALVWYACHCINSSKLKEIKRGGASNDKDPTSLVADRYFNKHGYSEKNVRVIK